MEVEVVYYTNGGKGKNQDSLLIESAIINDKSMDKIEEGVYVDNTLLFALSDGLNNHKYGYVASRSILEALKEQLPFLTLGGSIVETLIKVQKNLELIGNKEDRYYSMGGTIAGVYLGRRGVEVYSVGDSRVYRCTDKHFERLTKDHSIVEELYQRGAITSKQMMTHEQNEQLTSALMAYPRELKEVFSENYQIKKGDRYFLCTDGIWKYIEKKELQQLSNEDVDIWARKLCDMIDEKKVEVNHSFIIIKIKK